MRRRYPQQERPYDDYRPGQRQTRSYDEYGNRQQPYRPAAQRTPSTERYRYATAKDNSALGKKMLIVFILFAVVGVNIIVFSVLSGSNKSVPTMSTLSGSDNISGSDLTSTEVSPTDPVMALADELLAGMSVEEKVGQLFLLRSNGRNTEQFAELVSDCDAGGVVLFKSDFEGKNKQQVIDMINTLQAAAGGTLLVCVDEEGGTVVRMSGLSALRSEKYKSPQALYKLGGFEEIASDTQNKCDFLSYFGVNVNFGPVADVVTDSKAFMYKRAFGKKADDTATYVRTVVEIMKENRIGSCLKHFPGYGNSTDDTHEGLDVNNKRLTALQESDLIPFVEGVNAGADSIMVTHTIIKHIDETNPASMSPACIALIRDYLGFDGVVITDGLDMGAVIEFCKSQEQDPCVLSVLGGCDMLCTPSDPIASYQALIQAVEDGTITSERLDASVRRILVWKINLGLYDVEA